jgi:hypothetical protein
MRASMSLVSHARVKSLAMSARRAVGAGPC